MRIDDLTFECIDCGEVIPYYDIEKTKIKNSSRFYAILECGNCSGNNFQVFTARLS